MLHHPSRSRSAAAPLAGGYGATPPPVAPSAAARPPRAVATIYDTAFPEENGPLEKAAAEAWFYDQLDVIDCHAFDTLDALGDEGLIRRWKANTKREERAEQTDATQREWQKKASAEAPALLAVPVERRLVDERPLFTAADIDWIEADDREQNGRPRRDGWPEPGGEAFRALTDRDWRDYRVDADDDLPGPWFAIVVLSLIFGFTVAFGIGLARLVMVLL